MKFKRLLALILLVVLFITLSACQSEIEVAESTLPLQHVVIPTSNLYVYSFPVLLELLNLRTVEPEQFQDSLSKIDYEVSDSSDCIYNGGAIRSVDDLIEMGDIILENDIPVLKDISIADNFCFTYSIGYGSTNKDEKRWYTGFWIDDILYEFSGADDSDTYSYDEPPACFSVFYDKLVPFYKLETPDGATDYDFYQARIYNEQQTIKVNIRKYTPGAPAQIDLSLFTILRDKLNNGT